MRVKGREKDAAAFVRNLLNALPVRGRLKQQSTLAEPLALLGSPVAEAAPAARKDEIDDDVSVAPNRKTYS